MSNSYLKESALLYVDALVLIAVNRIVVVTSLLTLVLFYPLKLDSDGSLHGCPVGVPSNATLTDIGSVVVDTTVNAC